MTIVHLEMLAPPVGEALPAPQEPLQVSRQFGLASDSYLRWYRAVGEPWNWQDRLRMSAASLDAWLAQSGVEVWLLEAQGEPAGFCELDRRTSDVELVYFGLYPAFTGRGIGKWFLDWTIRHAWMPPASRLWLHTCDGDHPAALPNYQRAGFEIYRVQDS